MNRSAESNTWQNRMRAWTCMKRADSSGVASVEPDQ
jgi:hypothetical protein